MVNCIGIGFQRGTHTNWQLVQNDASGAPTLTDLGASFPIASTTNVLTLTLLAAPNGSEIGVRVVEEVSGAVVETMLDTDILAATQLLSPRNYMNNGATAAAVAYDCSGVYVETDWPAKTFTESSRLYSPAIARLTLFTMVEVGEPSFSNCSAQ